MSSVVEWIEHLQLKRGRIGFDSRSGQTKDYKNWYSQQSLLDSQQSKKSVKPPPCVVNSWQFDLKTEKSLRCLMAKTTWGINM